ncbi:unnamed protein product [Clonostachys rosea]|uniref:Peptide hydrolase n=1 Tax=Bionectria ochroleuca TaxID=29856 RepID=A0ABY6UYI3_BIOOC|nr:unnamed protein product [Clonostachys rosea]
MRSSALLIPTIASTALSCFLEVVPDGVDNFIRHTLKERNDEPLYTLEFSDGTRRQVTDDERWEIKQAHIRFIDVTETPNTALFSRPAGISAVAAFPSTLTQGETVTSLINEYNTENVKSTLTHFSSYYNRYYQATTGVESAQWLYDQVSGILSEGGATGASVRKVAHSWAQFSVVATIPGTSDKTIVVGAHQDSINISNRTGLAPGADDDGSGSMAILEALRVLLKDSRIASGEAPNTIEFHWYAGEEAGLLGSQAIFQQYATDGKDIAAMLNQDMVGYTTDNTFGLITDNTSADLNEFIKLLIGEYADIGYTESTCGYGCSDHASATRSGYPASFLFEAAFGKHNGYIHQTGDTIDKLSFDHILQHGKVILGFLEELAFSTSI